MRVFIFLLIVDRSASIQILLKLSHTEVFQSIVSTRKYEYIIYYSGSSMDTAVDRGKG
jgi:hypothetical protein